MLHVDLDNLESLPRAGEEALMHYGHIDILVNNAGISYRGSILETEMNVHHHLMRVNYFGHLSLTKCKTVFQEISDCTTFSFAECARSSRVLFTLRQGKFANVAYLMALARCFAALLPPNSCHCLGGIIRKNVLSLLIDALVVIFVDF